MILRKNARANKSNESSTNNSTKCASHSGVTMKAPSNRGFSFSHGNDRIRGLRFR